MLTCLNGGRLLLFVSNYLRRYLPRAKGYKEAAKVFLCGDSHEGSSAVGVPLAKSDSGRRPSLSCSFNGAGVEPRAHRRADARDGHPPRTSSNRARRETPASLVRSIPSLTDAPRAAIGARDRHGDKKGGRRSRRSRIRPSRPLRVLRDGSVRVRSQDARGRRVGR